MFKVIIAGGRDFSDLPRLTRVMDKLLSNTTDDTAIISGGAKGADTIGQQYAQLRNQQLIIMKADWDKHGKSAGYKRNAEMLEEADAVVCFWDGESRGTSHMIEITKRKGTPLRVLLYSNKVISSFRGANRFLSNFYPSTIEYEGITYPTVEHAFQAAKTSIQEERVKVSQADTPGSAKRVGRGITLRPDWEAVKYNVMAELVLKKFTSHPSLGTQLCATGNAQLIEGNTWGDTTWGVCNDKGKNWLGEILMKTRTGLCIKANLRIP